MSNYCKLLGQFLSRVTAPFLKHLAWQTRVTYTADRARSVLQMPLVSVRIGNPTKGHSFSILMEKYHGTDYAKMGTILNGLANTLTPKGTSLEKSMVKILLSITQSDRERECVRYAIYKASGMTPTAIR